MHCLFNIPHLEIYVCCSTPSSDISIEERFEGVRCNEKDQENSEGDQ